MLKLRKEVEELVQIWKEMLCSARDFAISFETYCEVKEGDYETFDAEADQEEDIIEDELTQRTHLSLRLMQQRHKDWRLEVDRIIAWYTNEEDQKRIMKLEQPNKAFIERICLE